jgi:opacity protein-like surface antigen
MSRTKLVLVLAFLVFGLCCSNVIAVAPLGPPVSNLGKGGSSIGLAYTYSKMDLDFDSGSSPGGGPAFTLDGIKTHGIFVDFAHGFSERWEAFIRVGAGSTRATDSVGATRIHMHDPDRGYAVGFGTKWTFWQPRPNLKFGGIFQVLWTKVKGDAMIAGNSWDTETDMTEIQFAVGPEYRINDRFSLYGGAFFNVVDGKFDASRRNAVALISYDIDSGAVAGGFLGSSITLSDNANLNLEWQHTVALDLVGVKLIFGF